MREGDKSYIHTFKKKGEARSVNRNHTHRNPPRKKARSGKAMIITALDGKEKEKEKEETPCFDKGSVCYVSVCECACARALYIRKAAYRLDIVAADARVALRTPARPERLHRRAAGAF